MRILGCVRGQSLIVHPRQIRGAQAAVLIHLADHAQITQSRYGQLHQPVQSGLIIQGAGQRRAGFGKESRPAAYFFRSGPSGLLLREEDAFLGLAFDLFGLAEQIDEDAHFGPQDFRNDRCEDEIDCPKRVRSGSMDFIGEGSDENDRRVFGPAALANERGGFQTVDVRHVDIEQDDREILLQ